MSGENAPAEVLQVTLELLKGRSNVSEQITVDRQVGNLRFQGTFKFRRPEPIQEIEIEVGIARLLTGTDGRPLAVTNAVRMYVEAVTTLPYVLAEHPDWFDLNLLREPEVINDVYGKFLDWDNSFRSQMQPTPQGGAKE